MWAIIGGSGFEKFDEFEVVEELKILTPYGEHSSSLKKVRWNGEECLFLSRHGEGHELSPTEINYRANIYALKTLGAKGVLSFSAVGSLKKDLAPEHLVFVDQYIDFTKFRKTSFCENGRVGHYSFAHPVEKNVLSFVKEQCRDLSFSAHFGKTYICVEGPRFSSVAESNMFIGWGADIIGMTNMPECYLAKEAGLLYLPFCFVTDYDCWMEEEDPVTIEIVMKRMKKNYEHSKEILDLFIPQNIYSIFKTPGINSSLFSGEKFDWI